MRVKVALLMVPVLCIGLVTAASLAALAKSAAGQGSPPGAAAPGDPVRLRDEIKSLERLLPSLADRGAALYLLAHHHARLGEQAAALALLKEGAALDDGFNPGDADAFAQLNGDSEFRKIVDRARSHDTSAHNARVAFTLKQSDLFPEGLEAGTATGGFYMSSMGHHKIVKLTAQGGISDFVKEGAYDLMPVGGVHIDASDGSVWCATDPGNKERSELVHFDSSGKLLGRYTPPGAGAHDLNDLVVRSAAVYVTDTYANRVYRFDRKARSFSTLDLEAGKGGRPVFYPNGITISSDGEILFVADMLGVLRVDLRSREVQDVIAGEHDTLAGIDGLYWYRGGLVGIQNSIGSNRVARWQLTRDGRRVKSSKTLERGTELVADPTTGALVGDRFYFMCNTGIANLSDDGKVVDAGKLQPVHMGVVRLK